MKTVTGLIFGKDRLSKWTEWEHNNRRHCYQTIHLHMYTFCAVFFLIVCWVYADSNESLRQYALSVTVCVSGILSLQNGGFWLSCSSCYFESLSLWKRWYLTVSSYTYTKQNISQKFSVPKVFYSISYMLPTYTRIALEQKNGIGLSK